MSIPGLDFPERMVIWDTEFTTWKDARKKKWKGVTEEGKPQYKEIVQFGGIKIRPHELLKDEGVYVEEMINIFVKPKFNPKLSDYFTDLTGITQEIVEKYGVDFPQALERFTTFANGIPCYTHGGDEHEVDGNCRLRYVRWAHKPPCLDLYPILDRVLPSPNIGINQYKYVMGTLTKALGINPPRRPHNALNDVLNFVDFLRGLEMKLAQPVH